MPIGTRFSSLPQVSTNDLPSSDDLIPIVHEDKSFTIKLGDVFKLFKPSEGYTFQLDTNQNLIVSADSGDVIVAKSTGVTINPPADNLEQEATFHVYGNIKAGTTVDDYSDISAADVSSVSIAAQVATLSLNIEVESLPIVAGVTKVKISNGESTVNGEWLISGVDDALDTFEFSITDNSTATYSDVSAWNFEIISSTPALYIDAVERLGSNNDNNNRLSVSPNYDRTILTPTVNSYYQLGGGVDGQSKTIVNAGTNTAYIRIPDVMNYDFGSLNNALLSTVLDLSAKSLIKLVFVDGSGWYIETLYPNKAVLFTTVV